MLYGRGCTLYTSSAVAIDAAAHARRAGIGLRSCFRVKEMRLYVRGCVGCSGLTVFGVRFILDPILVAMILWMGSNYGGVWSRRVGRSLDLLFIFENERLLGFPRP